MGLVFKVSRSEEELVKPAKATPKEVKSLSDWDDRVFLREWVSCILFYSAAATTLTMEDPRVRIKRALAEALVYYYPMAGRIKEFGPKKRLVVDCTSEGVSFISAEADIRLDQLGVLRPPFPYDTKELLYNRPTDATATLGCPIFVMQVTLLACGGFILAFSFNHVMCDVVGAVQFVTAVSELSLGALAAPYVLPVWQRELLNAKDELSLEALAAPSVLPIWQRELLNARDDLSLGARAAPSVLPVLQRELLNARDELSLGARAAPSVLAVFNHDMMFRSFFFGPRELEAIRARVQPLPGDRLFTSFELISACIFHCRVVSLDHQDQDPVCAAFAVNARSKFIDPPLPSGYYGNASFTVKIIRPAQSFHNLRYVIEQVKKAKDLVTQDYLTSSIQQQVSGARPPPILYGISDVSRAGFSSLDFGWGSPLYAGTTNDDAISHIRSFMVASTNTKGEEGRLITLCMPQHSMEKFDLTLRTLLGSDPIN